jgi:hypothetical protein
MSRLNILPIFKFPDTIPSVYDRESKTCIEMTAKVYNAMRELQLDYDKFITGTIEYQKEFESRIVKIMHDYIHSIDMKIDKQNLEVANAVEFMKTNLSESITELLTEMKNNGELDEAILNSITNIGNRITVLENTEYTLEYEEGTENLILVKTVKEGE